MAGEDRACVLAQHRGLAGGRRDQRFDRFLAERIHADVEYLTSGSARHAPRSAADLDRRVIAVALVQDSMTAVRCAVLGGDEHVVTLPFELEHDRGPWPGRELDSLAV